jgi:hypothetical protein
MSEVYVSVTTAVALISLNMPGETMRLSSDIVIVTRISLNNQDMRFLFFPLFSNPPSSCNIKKRTLRT